MKRRGKTGPGPELVARKQARFDREERERDSAIRPARKRPVFVSERVEPARIGITVPARRHKVDPRVCVTQTGIAGGRRTINVGKENVGRTVELEVVHGIVIVTDIETGEILAGQTLDYQYRKPMTGVNHDPRQYNPD